MEDFIVIAAVVGALAYLGAVMRRKIRSKSCGRGCGTTRSSDTESRTRLTIGGRSL
jgi:hypothetical protein